MNQDLQVVGGGWQRFEKKKKKHSLKKKCFFARRRRKFWGVIPCKMKGKHVFRRSRGYSGVGTEVMF